MSPEKIILEAKKHLQEHPFDSIHALNHHRSVWNYCLRIIKKENLTVNLDLLKIAAWWHDVERNEEECTLLRGAMTELKYQDQHINKVVEIINGHSWGKKQLCIEAKVLYDADKLEYVSSSRLFTLIEDYRKGNLTQERYDYYLKAWTGRIKSVSGKLNFDYSNILFEHKLKRFVLFSKRFKEVPQTMREMI